MLEPQQPISVREVIRLLWEADSYPILGNEDLPVSISMKVAALAKIPTAISSPDDPPEFARWLATLQRSNASLEEEEKVYWGIHDFFRDKEMCRRAALEELSALDQELACPRKLS